MPSICKVPDSMNRIENPEPLPGNEQLNIVKYWRESNLHYIELKNGEVYTSKNSIQWSLFANNDQRHVEVCIDINEKTKDLLKQRNENNQKIKDLKNKNMELTNIMCIINGICPQCRNWHYPHCGID